jgi:hypothetical protein
MTHQTHKPASVTQARELKDAAWADFDALNDELAIYAERLVTPPAGFYARLEHARKAWLDAENAYTRIYRAAEHKAARERELQAEAEINEGEEEPAADFDDLPDQYELADEAAYERQDWLMENYPQFN